MVCCRGRTVCITPSIHQPWTKAVLTIVSTLWSGPTGLHLHMCRDVLPVLGWGTVAVVYMIRGPRCPFAMVVDG